MHWLQFVLPLLIVCFGITDVLTTDAVLRSGGREMNPVMAWAMAHGLWPWAKLLGHGLIAWIIYYLFPQSPQIVGATGMAVALAFAAVTLHNYRVLP